MATATGLPEQTYEDAEGNPIGLAVLYFAAETTPAWFTAVPTDLSNYVKSVASADASVIRKDSGAEGGKGRIVVWGAVAAAGLAGIALL